MKRSIIRCENRHRRPLTTYSGEIAVRIIRTAKALSIKTISIYTVADQASLHVTQADEAVLLSGSNSTAYTDGDQIVKIAKDHEADAVIPGYGFLSENADFARSVGDAGLAWVGPSPKAIEAFGIKHVARDLAEKAGVPIVPGTKGLVESEEEAISEAERIGLPVMLKATGGGGGMGLVVCHSTSEVKEGFKTVRSRGEALFKSEPNATALKTTTDGSQIPDYLSRSILPKVITLKFKYSVTGKARPSTLVSVNARYSAVTKRSLRNAPVRSLKSILVSARDLAKQRSA